MVIKRFPSDPPTMNASLKKTMNVIYTTTSASGTQTLTYGTLASLISTQCFGNTTAFFRYFINSIRAWGNAGSPAALTLTDEVSGITAVDSGSYADRPHVGLAFPETLRPTKSSATTGDIGSMTTAPDESDLYIVYNITVWTVATI
jgi:hypothetical protein